MKALPVITLKATNHYILVRYNNITVARYRGYLDTTDIETIAAWAIAKFEGMCNSEIQVSCEYDVVELRAA